MRDLQENHQSKFPEDEDFPPLPPPLSPGEGDLLEEGNEGDVSKLAEVPAAKRKGVKRPQPKLDPQRLISERGLPALRTLFDDIKFKGKGHEAENLRLLMQKMENWAHRLFPKLQFEDFMNRVEKLGAKKEVQTCLKRIRLDMPLTHEDFTEKDEEQPAPPELQAFEEPDLFSRLVHSTPAPLSSPSPSPSPSSPPSCLTEEQRRRMELNRQRALERRLARQQQTDSQNADASLQSQSSAAPSDYLNISTDQNETDKQKVEGLDAEHKQIRPNDLQPPAEEGKDLDLELQEPPLEDLQPPAEEKMESGTEPPPGEMTEVEIQPLAEVEKSDYEPPAEEEESVIEPHPEDKIESEIQHQAEVEKYSELKRPAEETMESEPEAPPQSSSEAGN